MAPGGSRIQCWGGKIGRAIKKYKTVDFWQLSQPKNKYLRRKPGLCPKADSRSHDSKEPAKYGFDDIEYDPSIAYEKVTINRIMDLREVASAAECSLEDIQILNPELKTKFTPPNYPDFELNVPMGKKEILEDKLASIAGVSEKVALRGRAGKRRACPERNHLAPNVCRRKVSQWRPLQGRLSVTS